MSVVDGLTLGLRSRLPLYLQTEEAECGIACLAMCATHFGYQTDLVDMRRRFGLSLRGAGMKDLIRIADQVGLASRPVRLEMTELHLLHLPCILHWDLNHFVVLKSVGRGHIVIHDPAVGACRIRFAEASKHFTGVAMELTPTGGFQTVAAPPRIRMGAMLGRLRGVKRALGQLLLLALAIEVFAIASPMFLQWVVDHALLTADRDLLLTLALGFGLLLLLRTAVSAMRGWMLMVLSASLKVQARANLFSHLIQLPADYFEARHLGDVMSRFGSQETILEAITTELIEVFLDGLMVFLTLAIMVMLAPHLTAIVVVGAVLYGLLRWALYLPLRRASEEAIVWAAKRDSHFLETLRGITPIKLFNGQRSRRSHWLSLLVQTVNRQLTTQKLGLLFQTSNTLLFGGLTLVVVYVGATRVLDNTFTVGMLLAFLAYQGQFLERIGALIDRLVELRMLRLHAERLADIALTAPEPMNERAELVHDAKPATIEVRDLSFRYGDYDPWVLDGVSFEVAAGESLAIAGTSGCGKTTLLKLMAGLLKPTQGEILVDGQPLARIGVERYRSMIGVVMQDDKLFAGSIADNICFFSERPDRDHIEACARQAAVHDDIVAMAMGYETLIGDMGTVLSGGQKQRVLIARALYFRPGILLLDEATSHLDVGREKEVNAAVRANQVTRIIVAHRPQTIRASDRVIGLDQGKVVQDFQVLSDDDAVTLSRPTYF